MSSEKFSPVDRAAPRGGRRAVSLFVATGAGFGYCPVASGTVGALWGIPLVWALLHYLPGLGLQVGAAVLLTALAVPFCHDAEAVFKRKDDGRIVADEYMTFPLCMLGLPFTPGVIVVAFLTNRVFDVLKLPPASSLQRVPGGAGIVIDDAVAALYSLAVNHLFYHLFLAT